MSTRDRDISILNELCSFGISDESKEIFAVAKTMAKTEETECIAKHSKRSKTSDSDNSPADFVSSQEFQLEDRKSMGLEGHALNVPVASFSDNGGRSKEVNKQLDFFEDSSRYIYKIA